MHLQAFDVRELSLLTTPINDFTTMTLKPA